MTDKIYVNYDNLATIVCDVCNKIRVIDVSKIVSNKNLINIRCKCKCGHEFKTVLERRRFFRKNIRFAGHCYINHEDVKIPIQVTDISRSGVKFQHNTQFGFSIGDEIHIDFNLDDADHSKILKIVIVRSVTNNKIGAEFKSPEHYDKLGSYLLYS